MKQYVAKENITIGNGLGMHRFTVNKSYTEKALRALMLTAGQIHAYFTSDKASVKR